MPRKLRNYDFCRIAIQRLGRCSPLHYDLRTDSAKPRNIRLGVAFIGKDPARVAFREDPSTVYDITSREGDEFWSIKEAEANPDAERDLPKEVRRHSRIKLPTNVTVEILDDAGNTIASEQTVTENLSYSGAAIYTTLSPKVGSFVRINSDQYNVSIISIIRGVRVGKRQHPTSAHRICGQILSAGRIDLNSGVKNKQMENLKISDSPFSFFFCF